MNELRDRLDTPSGSDWVRKAAWVVLAASVLAFLVRGAAQPADPYFVGSRDPIDGFDEVVFRVTNPTGGVAEWCAMLADSEELRRQGLMDQEDLGGYDGMVFRFEDAAVRAFHMKSTIIPLAVAFFGADGAFVSAAGMDPCPPDVAECPAYQSAGPAQLAIEVPRGGLGRLGIGPGSSLELPGTPCPT